MLERYHPPLSNVFRSKLFIGLGTFLYKKEIREVKKSPENRRIELLLEMLNQHHPDTLSHVFEVAFIATLTAEEYFQNLSRTLGFDRKKYDQLFAPKVEEVFLGSLLHDIGKLGVPANILGRVSANLEEEQARQLHLHGQIGSELLKKVGLRQYAYFSNEHLIGNDNKYNWTEKDFNQRHPLTEFVSGADLVCSLLDKRRAYKQARSLEEIINYIKNTDTIVYSKGLIGAFDRAIIKKNLFPPYNQETFFKEGKFKFLLDKYNLTGLAVRNIKT